MDFSSIETLKAEGFKGFLPLKDFFNQGQIDKDGPGVYLVLRLKNAPPDFLEIGSGGKYDGRDPNDKLPKLKAKWLKGAIVLYIGQSGGENG